VVLPEVKGFKHVIDKKKHTRKHARNDQRRKQDAFPIHIAACFNGRIKSSGMVISGVKGKITAKIVQKKILRPLLSASRSTRTIRNI
jgi:hypothetical protein